jgi:glutathione S-transferase
MVSFEKGSKVLMKLGPANPAFIARGEQNFARFAATLDGCLKSKPWLVGERLTLVDFSVGVIPSARALDLSTAKYPEISRWYDKLLALPGGQSETST